MSGGGPGAEAVAGTPSKKRKPSVLALGDGGYAERVAAGKERMVGIRAALRERSVSMCAANNSRKQTRMDLPSALDAPCRYTFHAYEFGSHNFDFLRAIYNMSGRRCGVVGIDGDPNMPAHLSMTFEEFYLDHIAIFQRCPPHVCGFAGNCASFSMQSVAHHRRSEEPVNGEPDTYECAQKIEFANQTLKYIELIMLAAWDVNPLCLVWFETPKGYCTQQPIYQDVFLDIFGLKEARFCKCKLFGTLYRKEINIVNNLQRWEVNGYDYSQRMCTSSAYCDRSRANRGRHPKVVQGACSRESAQFGVPLATS
eukprot:CAMPEP_0119262856 /NCGR_PEP_ID=MMETSP1329-20130426/2442_1 /TAXON_ID=114041 /ORGANISM="Genus nov. species nov., Strain RCC1024" /LENGTH=310 /DNA_ID=CAMNT_0007262533 /DNA_START=45 /DNA_END=974 /DNA_ORIENTATION=+